ncbi:B3 domain-containing protein Os03g0212300-like [Miscanthus floridulus]|uniref:B3 domain-containing protein Os03g0212300-like n=1 Tax=Miscanthus floridulus TaxID=154761 RepID=UPI003459DBCF
MYAEKLSLARWKVEVFPDITDGGHLYLRWGWSHFACTLDLCDGYYLLLRYNGWSQINVKVFHITNRRKQYPHDFEADSNQLSLPITEPRSFAMILKKYHLIAKYLYGWGAFCANNNLNVGDTCFFSVIRVATCSNDDDEDEELEEWEEELKVEVRKTNDGCRR